MSTSITQTAYNYKVVRQFAIMTVVWGIVGMAVGVLLAAQLVWPDLNLNLPWTSFGRRSIRDATRASDGPGCRRSRIAGAP